MRSSVYELAYHAHSVFSLVLGDGSGSAGSPPDQTVKVAIIGAAALVFGTAITAFAATFQRNREPESTSAADVVAELRRRAEYAETALAAANARIDLLEGYCMDNNVNPHTGVMRP
jgi:hypothetical protein